MAEVVLDANVLVAFFDENDTLHAKALALLDKLEEEEHDYVLLDICATEALSALCRRTEERTSKRIRRGAAKTKPPPDLGRILDQVEHWAGNGDIRWVAKETERLHTDLLDIVRASSGVLNVNDALLVVLEREGIIDNLASFDADFDRIPGFRRIS